LQLQGGPPAQIEALIRGDLYAAALDKSEHALLTMVQKLTLDPGSMCDEDIPPLRAAGWTEEQISEAVYITALFAFFNRVADAFGLDDPGYRSGKGSPPVPRNESR
jgi:alkylhydroperoxidase family enzyme